MLAAFSASIREILWDLQHVSIPQCHKHLLGCYSMLGTLYLGISNGDQPWVFFGRNDAKAETLVLWPPHAKSWLIGNNSDPGRDWGQEEKGRTEDEIAGWHHRFDGPEFEWTPGDSVGQGGLACCYSWGRKKSVMTERLNWTEESLWLSFCRPLECVIQVKWAR